ncbi:hypothetical protein EV361DRAFT_947354 [Lentinula raphanica]|nr:hypothetical protein C8R42DRAFT_722985 [Lentinula raphanica]KAJ3759152.1 hypothetical protein EV360DRAFT_82373 [Lentinula raphanica]KAJ3777364.1 hypothetical protein FB446DRAFT_784297 [Lentinula raphanica]KAJ3828682.1 hypothetical protein F5880DRAFT_1608282 [Lentinula raphanica]KAJ3974080.1 hypothetical protein EV361DRAFT_947354 [Lentinula raphanica]
MFVLLNSLGVQLALLSTFIVGAYSEGNVTCSGSAMDWYTNQVGETACKTYERLRQICNSNFEVGVMNTAFPPDTCDEQVSDCCCNSIAYALAMLCLNCQQNIGGGSGYDAPAGDYFLYLQGSRPNGTCSPVKNQTLPTAIQSAVCNEEVKLFDSLYSLFWTDGSWYYMYTEQSITKAIASNNNNTFTHCASTTLNNTSSASSTPSSGSSNGSSSHSSKLSGGAIGGIVVGTIAGAVGMILLMWFCWWKRKEGRKAPKPEDKIEPFAPSPQRAVNNQRGGHAPSSKLYNESVTSPRDTSILSPPHPPTGPGPSYPSYTGYPTGLISAYGAPSPSPNFPLTPLEAPSTLMTGTLSSEKGARLYSSLNQSSTPLSPTPTNFTSMGSMSSRPILSPTGHSYNPSLAAFTEDTEREHMSTMSSIPERHMDGGRIPEELIDGRLPPAYGEQLD